MLFNTAEMHVHVFFDGSWRDILQGLCLPSELCMERGNILKTEINIGRDVTFRSQWSRVEMGIN